MVERCQLNVNAYRGDTKVKVIEADIRNVDIQDASMVVLNFTLQFLNPDDRLALLEKIFQDYAGVASLFCQKNSVLMTTKLTNS